MWKLIIPFTVRKCKIRLRSIVNSLLFLPQDNAYFEHDSDGQSHQHANHDHHKSVQYVADQVRLPNHPNLLHRSCLNHFGDRGRSGSGGGVGDTDSSGWSGVRTAVRRMWDCLRRWLDWRCLFTFAARFVGVNVVDLLRRRAGCIRGFLSHLQLGNLTEDGFVRSVRGRGRVRGRRIAQQLRNGPAEIATIRSRLSI